jgi:MMPL family
MTSGDAEQCEPDRAGDVAGRVARLLGDADAGVESDEDPPADRERGQQRRDDRAARQRLGAERVAEHGDVLRPEDEQQRDPDPERGHDLGRDPHPDRGAQQPEAERARRRAHDDEQHPREHDPVRARRDAGERQRPRRTEVGDRRVGDRVRADRDPAAEPAVGAAQQPAAPLVRAARDRELRRQKRIDASVAAVDAAQRAHPGLRVEQSGSGSSDEEFQAIFSSDLEKVGTTSLPVTLIILLVAFGALVAAGIPLLLAITGVVATMGLVGPLSQLSPVDESINEVILLIGLAVGVDYSLFYLRRMREERAAGRSTAAAIEAAAATSGRAVLISGITVMLAMAGMYFGGASTFISFATGTIAVVAVAVLGSLTVLPAVLSLLGDRVDRGRIPGLNALKRRMASLGLWSRVVDRVMRRPLLWAATSVALLLALAAAALQMNTGSPATDTVPQGLEVVQKFEHLQAAFPGETDALSVVIKGSDVATPAVTAAIAQLEAATHRNPALFRATGRSSRTSIPTGR